MFKAQTVLIVLTGICMVIFMECLPENKPPKKEPVKETIGDVIYKNIADHPDNWESIDSKVNNQDGVNQIDQTFENKKCNLIINCNTFKMFLVDRELLRISLIKDSVLIPLNQYDKDIIFGAINSFILAPIIVKEAQEAHDRSEFERLTKKFGKDGVTKNK